MIKIDEKEIKQLFNGFKNNNEEAFNILYTKYNRLVYGIAFSILKNETDSEDVVQIVFTKIYELNKEKFPTSKEANWLYTLTKNETISLLRKKNNSVNIEDIYEIEDNNNELNDIIDRDEFNRLLSKLNEKEKQIITLKILGNFSFNEISKLLNEPTGTVKWRYYKAINTIKILLSNLGMFIITFIIGLKALLNSVPKRTANIIENELEKEDTTTDEMESNDIQQDTTSSEVNEIKSENTNELITYENVIIQDDVIVNASSSFSTNYLGIGFLGISGIFLIVTIIFTIIFLKHQLKGNKKSSK